MLDLRASPLASAGALVVAAAAVLGAGTGRGGQPAVEGTEGGGGEGDREAEGEEADEGEAEAKEEGGEWVRWLWWLC